MGNMPNCDCYETYPGPGPHREECRVKKEIERLTADLRVADGKLTRSEIQNERLRAALEPHIADLERLDDVLNGFGKTGTFASTRAEIRLAVKELREALQGNDDD